MLYRFRQVETFVAAVRADDSGIVTIPGKGEMVAGAQKWVVLEADGSLILCTHEQFVATYEPADATAASYLEAMSR